MNDKNRKEETMNPQKNNTRFWTVIGLALTLFIYGCSGKTGGTNPVGNEEPAPEAPQNLSATAISADSVQLTWQDASGNELGFAIARQKEGETKWTKLGQLPANSTMYIDSSVSAATTYIYKVKATGSRSESQYSNEAWVSTPALRKGPAAPTNLQLTLLGPVVMLAWVSSANDVEGFRMYRKASTDSLWRLAGTQSSLARSWSDTHAPLDSNLSYRVTAYNPDGESDYSNTQIINTWIDPPLPPAAPSNFQATAISSHEVQLTWTDNSADESGFTLEHGVGADIVLPTTLIPANATSYVLDGLNAATTYTFRLYAHSVRYGNSEVVVAIAKTLDGPEPLPLAPTNASAVFDPSTGIVVTWQDNAYNETGFDVERQTSVSADWVKVADIVSGISIYTDSDVTTGFAYGYRVLAHNATGNSAYSNVATVTVPDTQVIILAPTNLSATLENAASVRLTWTDNSDNEDEFIVERSIPGGTWNYVGAISLNATYYFDNSVAENTTYRYRVAAAKGVYKSDFSNEVQITIPRVPQIPAAPTDLKAESVSASAVKLIWQDHANNELGFRIERRGGAQLEWKEIAVTSSDVVRFEDKTVAPSTVYDYRVRAYNNDGESDYCSVFGVTTPSLETVPATPSDLKAIAQGTDRINLTWRDNSTNESGFKVERRKSTELVWSEIARTGANDVDYQDNGLQQNTTYYYRVRSYNVTGNSDYSLEASATTEAIPVPATPSEFSAVATSQTEISLTWKDNSSNENGFTLLRNKFGSDVVFVIPVAAGQTGYSDTPLEPNTKYVYRLFAFNNISGNSDTVQTSAITLQIPNPAAPSDVKAIIYPDGKVVVTWKDNSDNESSFEVQRLSVPYIGIPNWSIACTVGANATSAQDRVDSTRSYSYRVAAVNAGGRATSPAVAAEKLTPPAAPTNLTGFRNEITRQVTLKWHDNADNEDSTVIMWYNRDGLPGPHFDRIGVVGPNVNQWRNVFNQIPPANSMFKIRVVNAAGVAESSQFTIQ